MKKQKKKIITILVIILAVSLIAYFGGFLQLSISVSENQVVWSDPTNCRVRATTTTPASAYCEYEGILSAPSSVDNISYIADNVSFIITYDIWSHDNGFSGLNIKYSVFNYQTSNWEVLRDKTYSFGAESDFWTCGASLYDGNNLISDCGSVHSSVSRYDKYWACLPGMESQLPPTKQSSNYATYHTCKYPGEMYNDKDYDAKVGEGDEWDEIATNNYLNGNYISDGKVRFKAYINNVGQNAPANEGDLAVTNVKWGLRAEPQIILPPIIIPGTNITVYRLENNKCKEYTIDQSNKLLTDYLVLEECKQNLTVELNWFQKINLWFENLFKKIFGLK